MRMERERDDSRGPQSSEDFETADFMAGGWRGWGGPWNIWRMWRRYPPGFSRDYRQGGYRGYGWGGAASTAFTGMPPWAGPWWARGWAGPWWDYTQPPPEVERAMLEDEREYLQDYMEFLKRELDMVEKRLKEIDDTLRDS